MYTSILFSTFRTETCVAVNSKDYFFELEQSIKYMYSYGMHMEYVNCERPNSFAVIK